MDSLRRRVPSKVSHKQIWKEKGKRRIQFSGIKLIRQPVWRRNTAKNSLRNTLPPRYLGSPKPIHVSIRFLRLQKGMSFLSRTAATSYKYSVAGYISFGVPKCETSQKSNGFLADYTYWLCIKVIVTGENLLWIK